VITAFQLALLLQSLAVLGLLRNGPDDFWPQPADIEMPQDEKFHEVILVRVVSSWLLVPSQIAALRRWNLDR
jgi:hypothetical protein